MSLDQLNQVLGRALLDEGFRSQLLNNAESVLKDFDLTGQEIEAVKQLNAEQFQALQEAFNTYLGGTEANTNPAMHFEKIETLFEKIPAHFEKISTYFEKATPQLVKGWPSKIVPEGEKTANAWPSKVVPAGPTSASGLSLPALLAIGAGAVVVIGAVIAGIFYFRPADTQETSAVEAPLSQPTQAMSDEEQEIPARIRFEESPDLLCLLDASLHLCAAPAGQVAGLIGGTADKPLMLPITPQQATLLISASGGSPPGVQGFTMMMLAGPETYQIKLPDASVGNYPVFLTAPNNDFYMGVNTFFPETTFSPQDQGDQNSTGNSFAILAGNWEGLSSGGTMTCEGASMNTPSEPPTQVVFYEDGTGLIAQDLVEDSTVQFTSFENNTYFAEVITIVDGSPVRGELELSLITQDLLEGHYSATYDNGCVFERPVTLNRVSNGSGGEILPPLKPAEFSVEDLFNPDNTFISEYAACAAFPDVCMEGAVPVNSISTLISGWNTFNGDVFIGGAGGGSGKVNISNDCSAGSQPETACLPASGEGDAYIPPYPADAGWGSKGAGSPTIISVLDVDAVSVINGIYDLWLMMGIPQSGEWDGYVNLGSENIQVYEVDLNTGQQTLWQDVAFTGSALNITTDQNRLFVIYVFGDQAAAQGAPQTYP